MLRRRWLSSSLSFDAARLQRLRASAHHGSTLYAASTGAVTHSIAEFRAAFAQLAPGERRPGIPVVLRGRVAAKREASRKLIFYTLEGCSVVDGKRERVQVMCDLRDALPVATSPDHWFDGHVQLTRGDMVEARGIPGATNKGELSVMARSLALESPCLHNLPLHDTLTADMDTKRRRRHVDLLVNTGVAPTFVARSRIISALRRHVDAQGFLEVDTPVLSLRSGGATATPFQTATDPPLFLRIAPELYLKRLIVGGLEGVYEIGKQFRHEGVDKTHVNEFTTMELYRSGWDYTRLMGFTEDLLRSVVRELHPSGVVNGIDFTLPFARVPILQAINERSGAALPEGVHEAHRPQLLELCAAHGISGVDERTSMGRLVDKLVGALVEPHCVQPTFLTDHPTVMSPLAKAHRTKGEHVTERFELFIRGLEYVNAYSELNDPEVQLQRLVAQVAEGDPEAPREVDYDYVEALSFGLPTCGGWGLGVDRLVMLLTSTDVIDDVILFPRETTMGRMV